MNFMFKLMEHFEGQRKKNFRKYQTLVATDYLRKSSNENLIQFKSSDEDIYGIISKIITYKVDYEVQKWNRELFFKPRFDSFVQEINDIIPNLNEFEIKLFRKFMMNSISTKRDLYLTTYILTNDISLHNRKMLGIFNYVNRVKFKDSNSHTIIDLLDYTLKDKPINPMEVKLRALLLNNES